MPGKHSIGGSCIINLVLRLGIASQRKAPLEARLEAEG